MPPKKQLPPPCYGWDGQTPRQPIVWKEGDPLEPLSFRVIWPLSCSAFPESQACPHWEIANSLHGECQLPACENIHIIKPKCSRLEIEGPSPGLTFRSLMAPLLMSAELLGGMFPCGEAKHMLAISRAVCVYTDGTVQIAFAKTCRVHWPSLSSRQGPPRRACSSRPKSCSPHASCGGHDGA